MFVLSNSQRRLFDGAQFSLQESFQLRLCLFDVFGLFECLLQEAGRFKADAETLGPAMIGNWKEWGTGKTIGGGRETKVALTPGTTFANGYDGFSSSEGGLTVNASLG